MAEQRGGERVGAEEQIRLARKQQVAAGNGVQLAFVGLEP